MWRQTVYLLLVILVTVANGAKHCPSATAFMQEYKEVLDQKESESFAKELKNMYDYEKSGELTHAAADNVLNKWSPSTRKYIRIIRQCMKLAEEKWRFWRRQSAR